MKATIECDCGETYVINEGEFIVCPYCGLAPKLLWNGTKGLHKFVREKR